MNTPTIKLQNAIDRLVATAEARSTEARRVGSDAALIFPRRTRHVGAGGIRHGSAAISLLPVQMNSPSANRRSTG